MLQTVLSTSIATKPNLKAFVYDFKEIMFFTRKGIIQLLQYNHTICSVSMLKDDLFRFVATIAISAASVLSLEYFEHSQDVSIFCYCFKRCPAIFLFVVSHRQCPISVLFSFFSSRRTGYYSLVFRFDVCCLADLCSV